MTDKACINFNSMQQRIYEMMETQMSIVGFTKIQALTMALQYYKGGHFEDLKDSDFEIVIKAFVKNYL